MADAGRKSLFQEPGHFKRYQLGFLFGPCQEWELDELVRAIRQLRQYHNVEGGPIETVEVCDDD